MLSNVKTKAIAGIAALSMAAAPLPALAWGKKEQGFVAGVATAVIVDQMFSGQGGGGRPSHHGGPHRGHHAPPPPPPAHYPPPVFAPPPPVYHAPPVHHAPRPSVTVSVHSTPTGQAFRSYSQRERRAIQRRLQGAGYYYGRIDGSFGPGTYNAIVSYARDSGAGGNLRSTAGVYAVLDGLLF